MDMSCHDKKLYQIQHEQYSQALQHVVRKKIHSSQLIRNDMSSILQNESLNAIGKPEPCVHCVWGNVKATKQPTFTTSLLPFKAYPSRPFCLHTHMVHRYRYSIAGNSCPVSAVPLTDGRHQVKMSELATTGKSPGSGDRLLMVQSISHLPILVLVGTGRARFRRCSRLEPAPPVVVR